MKIVPGADSARKLPLDVNGPSAGNVRAIDRLGDKYSKRA
jgi:hypothetical protein